MNQMQPHLDKYTGDFRPVPRATSAQISPFDILSAVRRQIWVMVVSTIIALALGIAYVMQATETYSSATSILIDAKKVGMTASSALEGSLTFESGAVDSQLQILMSDKLARSVARRLGLQNNFDFLEPTASPLGGLVAGVRKNIDRVIAKITKAEPKTALKDLPEEVRLEMAVSLLRNSLEVTRIGRTYVFRLQYSDGDQMLAQSIAGQYANAYLEDQLDSKFDATKRATNWMEERIRDLKASSLAADNAVQNYRAENNLIVASGRLLDEQSLTDATTRLTQARSVLDVASARYQRLKEIVDTQDVNAGLTQSLDNPNVAQLRARYLQAAKLHGDIAARYGEKHLAAQKAKRDMEEYKKLIFDELQNLLPGYQSDVAIAQAQLNSVQNSISQLRNTNASNDTAMVKLRALEQESESYKTLYSTFLQKFQEMQQQQSFPVTDARVISDASASFIPTSPNKMLALLASVVLGGAIGAAIGFLREWRDRGFRTASQVRDELSLEFLAHVPTLKRRPVVVKARPPLSLAGNLRLTTTSNPALQVVINEPFSQFSESIRAIRSKINAEFPKKRGVIIGVISLMPDEGKSTVAKNLASSLALQDKKTLLIDGDLRNPSLTGSLVGIAKAGLVDLIQGRNKLDEVIAYEESSGLAFMPGAARAQARNDIFGGERTHDLIDSLRGLYDVVVIDFPPVGALTDALSANPIVDGYCFVAQWGRTPRNLLKEFVTNHPAITAKTIGVVLNKVDMKKLDRYLAFPVSSQYGKYTERYFKEPFRKEG